MNEAILDVQVEDQRSKVDEFRGLEAGYDE